MIWMQGCTTLGPDYEEPQVQWLDEWETRLYGQLSVPDPAAEADELGFWWRSFNDPILNGLIEEARRENQGLRIAGLRILESRAQLGIATGAKYPQVQQASGSLARTEAWQTEGDNSGDRDGRSDYNVGFDANWELDFWGRFERGIESADAAFFASITNQRNVQVLLSAQVAQAYYAYRTTTAQIFIARENAEVQKRSFEITTQLFESGQDSELDLQQAKTQYLATLATIPQLEINLQQVGNALSVLLARPPGVLPELAGVDKSLPQLAPVMITALPAQLLMRRPDIRTSAWQVAAQSAQIGIAEADLYPSLSLFGSIGWSGNSESLPLDAASVSVGPSFRWNLFNYGRLENNVRVQDARLQQAIESYQNTILQASREIDDAAISVVKTREQGEILERSLQAAQRALTLSSTRYREGYSNFQRVLDAQRALAAQSNSVVTNQGAHLAAVIEFYRAAGGGWEPVAADQLLPESTRKTMQERVDWGGLINTPLPQPQLQPSE